MWARALPSSRRSRTRCSTAGTPAITPSARSQQGHARGVVGLGDGARVQRVGDRHRRAEALGQGHLGIGEDGGLLAAAEVRERQRGGRAPRRPARVAPALLARAGRRPRTASACARSKSPSASHRRARAWRRPISQRVERSSPSSRCSASSSRASSNSPRSIERVEQQHDRAAGERVDAVVDEVQRQAGVVLGLGDLPAAQGEVGRVPGRPGAQPQRPARGGLVAHRGDRPLRLVGPIGHHQRPHAQVVGRAPARLVQQQVALERLERQRGARGRVGRAELDPDPGAVGEEHALEHGSGVAVRSIAATRRARSRLRPGIINSASSDAASTASRASGSVSTGQLALEELGVIGVAGAEDVERGQAREQVDAALAIAHLAAARRAAGAASRQAGVEGDRRQLARACARGRRPARAPAARARGRPAAVCGAPRRAAVAAALHQQPADLGVGLRAALEQVAGDEVGVGAAGHQRPRGLAVHALALGPGEVLLDRGGDQAVGQALAVGREQAGGRQRVAGRGQLADRDAGDGRHDVRRARRRRGPRAPRPPPGRAAPAWPAASGRRCGRSRRPAARRRGPVDRLGAVRRDLAAQLAQQPRVAADRAMAVAAHRRRGLGRQAADELRGAARASAAGGAGRSPSAPRRAGSGGPTGRAGRRRGRRRRSAAAGRRSAAPGRRAPPARSGRPTARRRRRARAGAARRARSTATARRGRRASSSLRCGTRAVEQQRAGRRRGPVEQLRALVLGGLAQRRLEQRAHDAEGEVALERARRGAADQAAGVGGGQRGVLEQRRLAQARGRVEHDDPAVALGQAADRAAEHLELDGALDERRVRRSWSRAAVRRRGDGTPRCDSRHGPCSVRRADGAKPSRRRAKTLRMARSMRGAAGQVQGRRPIVGPSRRCCHR